MDLFEYSRRNEIAKEMPLALRIRPRNFEEFVGQEEIVGEGRLLRRAIEADLLFSSLIGPPDTGKKTLAMIIAFAAISAVMAGVADIRRLIAKAKSRRAMYGQCTILLVDEIHHFNKAQQDALLPHLEDRTIVLIGITTENPYLEVIAPLISRSRLFRFKPLSEEELKTILARPQRSRAGLWEAQDRA